MEDTRDALDKAARQVVRQQERSQLELEGGPARKARKERHQNKICERKEAYIVNRVI